MKKRLLLGVAVLVLAVCALTGCGSKKEKLSIFLPGEYIDESIVPEFEKKYNCEVDLELFESNEMMYTKFMSGGNYDILIPSDYMIERLIKEDQLQKLDMSKITNYKDIMDELKTAPFNGYDSSNSYSVPYFWGSTGIVYNKNNVSEEDVKKEGYAIFKNPKYKGKIYMYDSERDSFMMAFKDLGYSMNTENEDEIMAAYNWLVEINTKMDPTTVTDDVIDGMAQGRKDIAFMYSGDAAYVLSENEDMAFYAPEYGTNVFVDAMVIPKNAKNVELAHKFIDFVSTYDVALKNTESVGYTSAVKDVYADEIKEGGSFEGNDAYVPRTGYAKDEVFVDKEHLRKRLSELWIKVKAAK